MPDDAVCTRPHAPREALSALVPDMQESVASTVTDQLKHFLFNLTNEPRRPWPPSNKYLLRCDAEQTATLRKATQVRPEAPVRSRKSHGSWREAPPARVGDGQVASGSTWVRPP